MTIEGICSKCKQTFMNCSCENFHPPLEIGPEQVGRLMLDENQQNRMLDSLTRGKEGLFIDSDECRAIYDYFLMRAGYISYETDEEVHKFINRLREFLR